MQWYDPIDTMSNKDPNEKSAAGIGAAFGTTCSTADLVEGCTEKMDVFSYHYYNGISERPASTMPQMHWQAEEATTEAYLGHGRKLRQLQMRKTYNSSLESPAPPPPQHRLESG